MKTENRQFDKQGGSALILVVVVTVLLAVVGVMFLMVARASEMETGAVIQSKNLDDAVDTVIARINEVLVVDLFGNNNIIVDNLGGSDEPYDAVRMEDRWLASLEPTWSNDNGTPADPSDDNYVWAQFSRIFSPWGISLPAEICQTSIIPMVADADGDGVTDSGWEQVPGLTTSRGKPVFAAVRIIDNCAMLNLNAAHCFYQGVYADNVSFFEKPWFEDDIIATNYHDNQGAGSGRYLTEINYLPFLRGRDLNGTLFDGGTSGESGDQWYNIMIARGMFDGGAGLPLTPQNCQAILNQMENSIAGFQFFDIGDELELRNRYLVTSKTEARFEAKEIGPPINDPGVANYTLDAGGGTYGALRTPVDDPAAFNAWKIKVNPANFDKWDFAGNPLPAANPLFRYDRRHVCTVYSYDRTLNGGQGPLLYATLMTDGWTREQIADTQQSIFWYPLLYSELKSAVWTPEQIIETQHVFWPVGPVTTDITVPVYVETPAGSGVWMWQNNTNNTESRRRILHLLFAFREYFFDKNGGDLPGAAKSAAQVAANLIDYSDDDAIVPTSADRQGPFYDAVFSVDGVNINYGQQANVDCTFITEQIIEDMMLEVSTAILGAGNGFSMPFGLNATDIVFGYEKQPFISEVYADWDGLLGPSNALKAIAVEVINPYPQSLDMENWALKIGKNTIFTFDNDPTWDVPEINSGRAVYHGNYPVPASMTISGVVSPNISDLDTLDTLFYDATESVEIQILRPTPQWVSSNLGIDYIVVDRISDADMRGILSQPFPSYSLQRDDDDWKFVHGKYNNTSVIAPYELGTENTSTIGGLDGFQIGVADDGLPLCRWHELEVLGLYGNGPDTDPNVMTVSSTLADPGTSLYHFDLSGGSANILDYIATINRPDLGTLPGRININTAPVHVIAAAIPPTLADPNAADPAETVAFSALQLAQEIVTERQANGAYTKLSDLLNRIPRMKQYADFYEWADPDADNVGMQSIEDDIEEEHWILSNLANKFTVRSDVFTAYILVRLGQEGPQRRMIAIFDRSQVWDKNDRPKLVALHPVPDPR